MFMLLQFHIVCIYIPLSPGQVLATNLWGAKWKSCNRSKAPIPKIFSLSSSQGQLGSDSAGEGVLRVQRTFLKTRKPVSVMSPALLPKAHLGLALFTIESQKSSALISWAPSDSTSPTVCSSQQASLILLHLPHFLQTQGLDTYCYLCLEVSSLFFPKKDFLTLHISALHTLCVCVCVCVCMF